MTPLQPPRIVITMGEPGGVGPEIIVKALDDADLRERCTPVVVGDPILLAGTVESLESRLEVRQVSSASQAGRGSLNVLPPPGWTPASGVFPKGRPSRAAGRAVEQYIKAGVGLCMSGEARALVTAPISKESLALADLPWPGHTELLAGLTGTREFAMMLVGGPLRVILVTIHVALSRVPDMVTRERVLRTIRLADRAARMLRLERARIGVAGLNPHGGEAGLFGNEERDVIQPAVGTALAEGIRVSGPYPPDTIFHRAHRGDFDIVVCMYHDQGLIPLKMIAFETGVNVTVGLPFVRTSPDHGTAFDIAGTGQADPRSMIEAVRLAIRCAGS